MFDYGFKQEKDFTSILGKSTGGRPSIDYALSLDCAKEISMLQRTEKGKQARQYFIACEKLANPAKFRKNPSKKYFVIIKEISRFTLRTTLEKFSKQFS